MEVCRLLWQYQTERKDIMEHTDFYRAVLDILIAKNPKEGEKLLELRSKLLSTHYDCDLLDAWCKEIKDEPLANTASLAIKEARYQGIVTDMYWRVEHISIIALSVIRLPATSGKVETMLLAADKWQKIHLSVSEMLALMVEGIYYDIYGAKTYVTGHSEK